MCKYCDFKFDENSECWDRVNTIHKTEVPFGLTKIEQRTSIFVLPDYRNHIPGYDLNLEVSVGDDIDHTIFDTYIPIQYCPFCGRKLTLPDEEVEK